MSDTNGSTQQTTATATGGNPPAAPVNSGAQGQQGRQISEEDYNRYQRYEQQLKGQTPLVERARAAGFDKPEAFDEWAPVLKTFRDKKINPQSFIKSFEQPDPEVSDKTDFDPEKFKNDLKGEFKRESAMERHEELVKGEGSLIDKALASIVGDSKLTDFDKRTYRAAVREWMDENRELYPKGHPLHTERLAPLNDSIVTKAVEFFKAERAKATGEAMNQRAEMATRSPSRVTTPGGAGGTMGKAKDTNPRTKDEVLQMALEKSEARVKGR